MSNWYRRRRRRSAIGVQVIENWTSESKRLPLINSLCQIAKQSEEIIEGLCFVPPETTTAEPSIVTEPTSKQVKNDILGGTCQVNFAPTLCSERELEIVFIVEATTEYNNLEQVFNQLLLAVEAVEKSRFSLFLNEKVLLISLDLEKFISELKKIDTATVSTGSMNWSNVQEKAKIMLDPNANHDQLFESDEMNDLPEATINDLGNGTNDESNYTTDDSASNYDYDAYNVDDGDSYYSRRRKRRSAPDDVVGFENLADFAKNSPVFVALPVVGGAEPENFGEEIKVLVFEMGVRFKKESYKHILLETDDQFACNFVKTICPLEVDQIDENVAELVTVVTKLPDTSRTLSCFADLDILPHGSGTICRTEVKDSSKPLELIFVIEVIDVTNLAAILDEVYIMTNRFGNGVDAYRVSIMLNNKLIALSLSFDQLKEQFGALKSTEVETGIEMDWEIMISDFHTFFGGDVSAFVGGSDDWSAYKSDAYNYDDADYDAYGAYADYYGRRRRSTGDEEDAGPIGIENYDEFLMHPKYIIALPQIGGIGPVTQTGEGLTALPKIFQDLMKDEETKHKEQWIRFVWFEYGSDFHGIDGSQHILLYNNGQNSLTCGAREFVCEFTRLHQTVIPDPLDLTSPPICIGGKANIVIMIDEDFERADQMKQFADQFEKSFPVTRGSEISIMTYGKNVEIDGITVDNIQVALSTADATLAMMSGSGKSFIIFMNSHEYNEPKQILSSRTISKPNVFFMNINNPDLSGIKKWSSMLSDRVFELIDISAYGQDTIDEFDQAISDVLENICTAVDGSYPGGSNECSGSVSEYIAPPCFIPDQIALHFVVDMSASVKSFMLSYYKEIFDQILTSFSEMFPDRIEYVKVSTAQGRSASKVKVQEIVKSNDIDEIRKAKSELLRSRRGTVRLEFLTEELKKTQNQNEITIILSSTGRELQGRIHPGKLIFEPIRLFPIQGVEN